MHRKIQKPYREMLLTQLSRAAIEDDYSEAQIKILDQAALLLWRFDKRTFPLAAADIVTKLNQDIKIWLPPHITLGLEGFLKTQGRATYLAYDLAAEMDGNPLTRRDMVFSQLASELALIDKNVHTFRDVLNSYRPPTIIPVENDLPKILTETLYSKFTSTFYEENAIACPSCGYPLEPNNFELRCPATPCYKMQFSSLPPYLPANRAAKSRRPEQLSPQQNLKINHEFWRTLSVPLLVESKLADWIAQSAPKHLDLSHTLNPDRPGLLINSRTEKPSIIEIINSANFRPIVDYCLENNNNEETWLILPHSTHIESYQVRRMLPINFITTTLYSFTKQYLAIKHGIGVRYRSYKSKH